MGKSFADTAIFLDVTAVVVSTGKMLYVDAATLGGLILGGPLGAASGYALATATAEESPLGGVENACGGIGWFFVFLADVVEDRTGFDPQTGEVVVGQDVIYTGINALAGFIPEAHIDEAVSAWQVVYDADRTTNPPYMELRLGWPYVHWVYSGSE